MNEGKPTRRDFVKGLVVLPVLTGAPPGFNLGEPEALTNTQAQPEEKVPSVLEGLTQVAQSRYGQFLSPEQLEEVKKEIEGGLKASQRLRAVELNNNDEPDFVFFAS